VSGVRVFGVPVGQRAAGKRGNANGAGRWPAPRQGTSPLDPIRLPHVGGGPSPEVVRARLKSGLRPGFRWAMGSPGRDAGATGCSRAATPGLTAAALEARECLGGVGLELEGAAVVEGRGLAVADPLVDAAKG